MKLVHSILLFATIVMLFFSCKDDLYSNSRTDVVTFSEDTIRFDTIFTEKGSITQYFLIKNNQEGIIKINKIYLESGSKSEFYINVNGIQGPLVENIEIEPDDSVFVFVQTKLHEQNVDTLLFHEDKIIVDYNSRQDAVVVTAWGQDVVNYKGATIATTTFTSKKPYVIYDSLVVAENEILTIEAGVKIYLHYNANIIIRGSLKILGTGENPVCFSSDRLEETYQLLPGQWGSIIFESTSSGNDISYAKIYNGVNGLLFRGDEKQIDCTLQNSQISNMSGYGIYAQNAHIDSYNCVLVNCEYNIINILGGWFNSVHNTISNAGTPSGRKYYPSVHVADFDIEENVLYVEQAYFFNSIVVGTMANEIEMTAKSGDNSLPCLFKNCLLRDTYTKADSAYYKENVYYDKEKNLFASSDSFMLDTLSQAMDIGNLEYANLHTIDLMNHSRIADGKPDVGAMEYYYEPKKEE